MAQTTEVQQPQTRCPLALTVNGQTYRDEVEPRLLLVHYLRDNLGLTGTHIGCDTTQCGACTVLLDGKAVKSCTVFAAQADGTQVTTIEGLAPRAGFGIQESGVGVLGSRLPAPDSRTPNLHPLQEGFWEEHGLQCGFCTPGMIMASYDLLQRQPNPSEEQIRHGLEGNLCRCTGYQNIVKAVQYAARRMKSAELGAGS